MAEIRWTTEAANWLEEIYDFIAADDPDAAFRTVTGIYETVQRLSEFPERGYIHRADKEVTGSYYTAITGSPITSKNMKSSKCWAFFMERWT